MPLTPAEFVTFWNTSTLREQQGAQMHFQQLVELVGLNPASYFGTTGDKAVFEQHVEKTGGGAGRADVWYRGRFAWEYKGKLKDLDSAYSQLLAYRSSLDNPPLLIVCDFLEYRIYPQWPNLSGQPIKFYNADLLIDRNRDILRWALTDPDKILQVLEKQRLDSEKLTAQLADKFAHLSDLMRQHPLGETPKWGAMQIARFLTKLVFSLFVEDVGLLPPQYTAPMFRYLADGAINVPEAFAEHLSLVFSAMNGETNRYNVSYVPYFNGGIFAESAEGAGDGIEVLDITEIPGAVDILSEAADADWRSVNPTIFGTLFEGALDSSKRAQLGAHYTSESDIRLVIDPVLMAPLLREWDATHAEAAPLMQTFLEPTTTPKTRKAAETRLRELRDAMVAQIEQTTVLDPACGSGNFLYVALKAVKDLERKVRDFFRPLAPDEFRDVVTPRQFFGIEKDPFAAKLAHVVLWIGYLQWRYEDEGTLYWAQPRKQPHPRSLPNPIIQDKLKPTDPDRVTNDDAILRYDADGKPYEPAWPLASIIVSNPPFLGSQSMRGELGDSYTDELRKLYARRVPGSADLVTYWFEKARAYLESGKTKRVGLISTNSIRGGANRAVLDEIKKTGDIFMAWSDKSWRFSNKDEKITEINSRNVKEANKKNLPDAAVRISIVGFATNVDEQRILNGQTVDNINPDLTDGLDMTKAKKLKSNSNISFQGPVKVGKFDISQSLAADMLGEINPSGKNNSDVLKPYINGDDITKRSRGFWIIDFDSLNETQAREYLAPFKYVEIEIKPERLKNNDRQRRESWWKLGRTGNDYHKAVQNLNRQIFTPRVAKYRVFVWQPIETQPSDAIVAIARDDDYFFGVLHSYLHEIWSLRLGTSLEDRPRYTPTTTFETFPFPYPPNQPHPPTPSPWGEGESDAALADGSQKGEGESNSGQNSPLLGRGAGGEVAAAAALLHAEREAWLNPAELIQMGADEKALKDRTLTHLYNAVSVYRGGNGRDGKIPDSARKFAPRMAELHDALDSAVLRAYGWDDLIGTLRTPAGDEAVLRRLLAENQRRA